MRWYQPSYRRYMVPNSGGNAEAWRATLLGWVDCSRTQRVVKFMTLTEMKAFHENHGGMRNISWSGKVDVVRERLAGALHQAEDEDDAPYHHHDEDENVFTGNHAVVTELTRSSFMKSVPKGKDEGQAKYMALGHRVEKPFISSAMDILNEVYAMNLEAAYAPGLVAPDAKEDGGSFFFMRDTADAVFMMRDDEDDDDLVDAIPVECKCSAVRLQVRVRSRRSVLMSLVERRHSIMSMEATHKRLSLLAVHTMSLSRR